MQNNFRERPQAVVYLPLTGQLPAQWRLVARLRDQDRALKRSPPMRAIVCEIAPEALIPNIHDGESGGDRTMSGLPFTILTLGVVSVMALILGAVGLYGVLSYVVAERARDRGAHARRVSRAACAGWWWRRAGRGVGTPSGSWAPGPRQSSSRLFQMTLSDTTTFAFMSLSMVVVLSRATYRLAVQPDPTVASRPERSDRIADQRQPGILTALRRIGRRSS